MSDQNKKENNENIDTTTNTINDKNSEIKKSIFFAKNSIELYEDEEAIPSKKTDYLGKIKKLINKLTNQKYIKKFEIRKYLKKYFFSKSDLFLFIINIISIISYKIGLMPSDKDPSECTIKHGLIFYVKIGIFTAISANLYSIYISITLFTRKRFLHYLYTLPIFIYFIRTYYGAETVDHGLYNSIGWIIGIIILVPFFLFFATIINLILKKRYICLIIIFSIIFLIIIIYNNLPGFSCEDWDLGLNNTRINNDENIYPCHILIPGKNKCYLKRFNGFFDLSKYFRPSCSAENIIKKEKKIFLDSLDHKFFGISKLNHFGYPKTTVPNKYDFNSSKDLKEFQDLINHNIIKMDLYNKNNYPNQSYPEVELFFDENDYGNIKINITRNEKLSKERKKIAKNRTSLYNNVLIIYLDAFLVIIF